MPKGYLKRLTTRFDMTKTERLRESLKPIEEAIKKTGRPSDYNEEVAKMVCETISTHPYGLKKLEKMYSGFPERTVIFRWLLHFPIFHNQYLEAKRIQSHLLADEAIDMANDVQTYEDKDGVERIDAGILGRAKFNFECKRWHASKLEPKVYGDSSKFGNKEENNKELLEEALERNRKLDELSKREY